MVLEDAGGYKQGDPMRRKIDWRRFRLASVVLGTLMGLTLAFFYWTYEGVAEQARQEELAFWKRSGVHSLSPVDRSALLNYIERTGEVPSVLPWWELDEDRCSATVTKYVALFTGVELVHAAAWRVRQAGYTCRDCVNNGRKLITKWEGTRAYGDNGDISRQARERIVGEVKNFAFDPNKVYMLGLLWSNTRWWDTIQVDGEDINSHVALVVRGQVIHFIHTNAWSDPLKVETLDELFQSGDLAPVWLAEVAHKSRAKPPSYKTLVAQPLVLPKTMCELPFTQRKAPWAILAVATAFDGLPFVSDETNARIDTFVEKSILYRLGAWGLFEMYPTFHREEEVFLCDD